jgi:hypothetical protein
LHAATTHSYTIDKGLSLIMRVFYTANLVLRVIYTDQLVSSTQIRPEAVAAKHVEENVRLRFVFQTFNHVAKPKNIQKRNRN